LTGSYGDYVYSSFSDSVEDTEPTIADITDSENTPPTITADTHTELSSSTLSESITVIQ